MEMLLAESDMAEKSISGFDRKSVQSIGYEGLGLILFR